MILVMSVIFWGAVVFLLLKLYRRESSDLKQYFWPGLIAKVVAGVCLGLVYIYYYQVGDTFGFFNDAQRVVNHYQDNPLNYLHFLWAGNETFSIAAQLINIEERSMFMVKLLSLATLVSFDNYWVASVGFSIVSFLGCWYCLKKVNLHFPHGRIAAVISFLFIPSFLFWSSGVIKESMSIGALMVLAGSYIMVFAKDKVKWWEGILAIVAVWILWSLKYYWIALFLPSVLATLIATKLVSRFVKNYNRISESIIWAILFCFIVLLASNIHPNFYLSRFLLVIVDNYNAYSLASENDPAVHFSNLQASWTSIVANSPWALFSGLYRPFIFESSTIFQFFISIENTLLMLLSLYNLKFISSAWKSPYRLLVISTLVYIVLLAIFLTLSTPNFGTLSRYKVGFTPFLFFLVLYQPCKIIFKKN